MEIFMETQQVFKFLTICSLLSFAIPLIGMDTNRQETVHNPTFLINNPVKALEIAHKVRAEFAKECKWLEEQDVNKLSPQEMYQAIQVIIAKYEQQCPFFLLGECSADFCLLTRTDNPGFRRIFEEIVSDALLKKLQTQPKVEYTSFGSGGMLQDLLIATRTLAQKPDAHLIINLIDINFTPYVASRDLLKDTREISPTYTICLNPIIDQIIDLTHKEWGGDPQTPAHELVTQISGEIFYQEARIKQFVTCLKKMFPDAKITLLVHNTQAEYLSYRKKNNLSYPDVIATADIQDEISLLRRSIGQYRTLISETVTNNPSSKNFFLKYSPQNQLVDILSITPKISWPQQSYKDAQGNEFVVESAVRIDLKDEAAKAIARAIQLAKQVIGS